LPAVAHLRDGHYVVLYALTSESVVVGDPSTGVVTVSPSLFRGACSGSLLVFQDA
jgi:ABC-type bacteriocin/lantibiotic exporter with double-glycine peptidase domain